MSHYVPGTFPPELLMKLTPWQLDTLVNSVEMTVDEVTKAQRG
jgi:hypothetical protein